MDDLNDAAIAHMMSKFAKMELDTYGALIAIDNAETLSALGDPNFVDNVDDSIKTLLANYGSDSSLLSSYLLFLLQVIHELYKTAHSDESLTEVYLTTQRLAMSVEADPVSFWNQIHDEQQST